MYPVLFKIGHFSVYSYGLLVAVGFLLATFFILRDSEKAGLSREGIFDCLIAILIGGIIGGRLLFVAVNWRYYFDNPIKIITLKEGGMAIHGAIVMALLTGGVTARVKRLPFWGTADIVAPYIALGHAVGRVGCFLNGCCYGKPHEGFFGVIFPGDTVARIPTQLYSSLGLFVIYIILRMIGERKRFEGQLFALYLIFYSIFRFAMDFARGDNPPMFSGLTLAQIISAGMFVCGVVVYSVRRRVR